MSDPSFFDKVYDVVKLITSRCTEPDSGGRMIDAILTNTLLPMLSQRFLTSLATGEQIDAVSIDVDQSEFVISQG